MTGRWLCILKINIRAWRLRRGSFLASVFGTAFVVAVFVGLFSIASSFSLLMKSNADPDTYLVMSEGAAFESASLLNVTTIEAIRNSPAPSRDEAGPRVSFELTRPITVQQRQSGQFADIVMRGVSADAYRIRSRFRRTSGALIAPGTKQVIVGRGAASRFAGLNVGNHISAMAADWEIVGVFENGGGASESEVWADLNVMQSAFRLANTVQSARVKLTDVRSAAEFQGALNRIPGVAVFVQSEGEFLQKSTNGLLRTVQVLGLPVIIAMALGAVLGSINTMYNLISSRIREIGMLRAIGFEPASVSAAVLVESMLIAAIGSVAGIGLVYLALDGHAANSNFLGNTQFVFKFSVGPRLMLEGVVCALTIGFISGLLPARRAARLPVVTALRRYG